MLILPGGGGRAFCYSRQQDCYDLDTCAQCLWRVPTCLSRGISMALERLHTIMRYDSRVLNIVRAGLLRGVVTLFVYFSSLSPASGRVGGLKV